MLTSNSRKGNLTAGARQAGLVFTISETADLWDFHTHHSLQTLEAQNK